ncbi:non-canonical purine NTP pyrophosphatase [Serratia symbiotica]|uniref:non-canonical purine NTP pyrophosphatase n=1 Tax=Serratia symbiotica TaxID=138074 RepID=UPI002091C8A2|nr:non-canonical purine NTP pyrophosphatase [Serratia symbiotica]USS95649.1 non-canonical purine NTP pyrophosphatase [Serratia symbiotica]
MQNVVLATANPGKVREFADLLADVEFKVIAQTELGVDPAEETSLPAIADDSGLAVDALGGAPAIYSARYAGDDASDRQNLDKLLAALKDVPQGSRGAQFHCVLVYMRHAQDPTPLVCHGSWVGEITIGTLGEGGFGYDPVFYLPELGHTAAELSREEKSALSHRAKALKLMLAAMRNA